VPELGDGVNLDHRVYDRAGALTAATVSIAVTKPDGTSFTAPTVTSPSTGYYQAETFVPDATGVWTFIWSVSGTVTDVSGGSFLVTASSVHTALGGPYATRAKMKRRMGIPDSNTTQDSDIDDELLSASNAINSFCGRQFGRVEVATARQYPNGLNGIDIDDAYSLTGMLIDDVAYSSTTWIAEPLDGVVNGVPGWPFTRLARPFGTHPIYLSRRGYPTTLVTVTALWGWAQVPPNVHSACLLLAADGLKSKDAPFGVAGFGDYVVRVRANPKVKELLDPYVREIVKAGS
jgi:hypothetical protein